MKIEEIAKLAGVSPATVSNVLNNRKNVGENTRKRILEICNASGYSQKRKKKLEKYGYQFVSETDTEVIAHLLDYYYKGNPLEAVTKIMHRMEGSYALGIIFKDHPEELYAVRKDSPLIV